MMAEIEHKPEHGDTSPSVEDYLRATAEAVGVSPDGAVAALDQAIAHNRQPEHVQKRPPRRCRWFGHRWEQVYAVDEWVFHCPRCGATEPESVERDRLFRPGNSDGSAS